MNKKEETKENQTKLGVYEEEDFFEEFDDEGNVQLKLDWNESNKQDKIDIKAWQEEWEDEEINDQFEKILRSELEAHAK